MVALQISMLRMVNYSLNEQHTRKIIVCYIFFHCLAWSLIPILVRYNLPLDAMEGTTWGHQLQWGYDKNPFLNAWLTHFAISLDGGTGYLTYVFCQLCVAASMYSVWQIGKKLLSPVYAAAAILSLEGIQYYNFHALDFNDNTLELGIWALICLFCYKAVQNNRYRDWIATGILAGLGLMAKYYTFALLLALTLFLLSHKATRKQLLQKPALAGLAICLVIILPHTIWLFHNDFITVKYVFARAGTQPTLADHIIFPSLFTYGQLQAFLPALLLLALLYIGKKPFSAHLRILLSNMDKSFLFWISAGPILLTLLLSLACGTLLRDGWGMPLQTFWGLGLLAIAQPAINPIKWRRFVLACFSLLVMLLCGYTYVLNNSSTPSSANFPGRQIATYFNNYWQQRFHQPLQYVAGSRWVGGNISFYSKDHPAVYIEWDKRIAPWISEQQLKKHGALFVWEQSHHEYLPPAVLQRFPQLEKTNIVKFQWLRNKSKLHPIEIGVAVLPPEIN